MERAEYLREWHRRNPGKAAEYQRRRRARNPGLTAEQSRRQRKADPGRDKRWRERNKESAKAAEARWRKANKDKRNAITAARRARLLSAMPPLTNEERADVIALYAKARALTELTGEAYHVDHKKALVNGGLHHPDNLQVLRGVDNQRKGRK